ncbi:MAG: hypothetical protein KGY74_07645 [Candidatus Cloacimonetes bacterium]|nr:hypothetical protein [Candidatus Cloacimonadota bacterium]
MKTTNFYKTVNSIGGVALSTSLYAGNSVEKCVMTRSQLVVEGWQASNDGDMLKIYTPVGFEIMGAKVVGGKSGSAGTVQVYNGGTAITDAISASGDHKVRYANDLDQDQTEFNASDDDLYLKHATASGAKMTVIMDIIPEN